MPTALAIIPITLTTPLTVAKLGPPGFVQAAERGLGIVTIGDLLRHFPRRYEDRTSFKPIAQVRRGEAVTISGRVAGVENVPTRSRMVITKIAVRDLSGLAFLVFFNQWFLKKQFDKLIGRQIVAYGKTSPMPSARGIELSDVEWELVDENEDALAANRIVPIYPLADGVRQDRMRRAAYDALRLTVEQVTDPLPQALRERYALRALAPAIRAMHFPESFTALEEARRRLTFDEFFAMQLALAQSRLEAKSEIGIRHSSAEGGAQELTGALPFDLTEAQKHVIDEITADMLSDHPMNRLVQGDVGSGKTVVALAAVVGAVRSGYQAAIMAPTEILAEQHYRSMRPLLTKLDIPVTLLTGSVTAKEKADRLQCVADGHFPVVVGTHAVIQEGVVFKNLGLAVIDEQHRFGVLQRATLRGKAASGAVPDVLVMTATPIPRTLTLTVYGDLDVSVIDQLPPGRKPIKTHWKRGEERPAVYESLRRLLKEGRQAYVVCPLIEESEKLQARAATELAEHLAGDVFPEFKVGLLHGQMKAAEKDLVMARFREREIDLLVATTVIEVGVDVPNASIMVIEDADRFGLAQLHQLRGRVGRGETQSYCLLIADPKTPDGAARMEAIARTSDGFEIAEVDLKLRGPGDFYGTRQSGVELLPFIDVVRDVPILHEAREAALDLLAEDPHLRQRENAAIRDMVNLKRQLLAPTVNTN